MGNVALARNDQFNLTRDEIERFRKLLPRIEKIIKPLEEEVVRSERISWFWYHVRWWGAGIIGLAISIGTLQQSIAQWVAWIKAMLKA